MKKLLLSLVVVAASGAYVLENRAGTQAALGPDLAASIIVPTSGRSAPAPATSPPALRTSSLRVPATLPTPSPSTASAQRTAVDAAPTAVPDASIDVAEITPPAVPGASAIATDASPAASAPPLPRTRPAAAPDAPFQVAQASTAGTRSGYVDGTYQGVSANAYYGRVEVSAVVQGGQIKSVNVLQYPNDRGRSRRINGYALPALEQEVIAAQSARVDVVSGATLTSEAYMQSLASALAKAGGNNA